MIEVILFLILCAVRFLSTIVFMDFFSNTKNTCVNKISSDLYKLKARSESPNSIPTRMKKNISRIRAKLNESIARGKK